MQIREVDLRLRGFGKARVLGVRDDPAISRHGSSCCAVAAGFLLAVWVTSAWLIFSGDRLRDATIGFFLRDKTAYSSGFSDDAFRTVAHGMADTDVRRLLGAPLREDWLYAPQEVPLQSAAERSAAVLSQECVAVTFERDVVVSFSDPGACTKRGIRTGLSLADVAGRLGTAPERCWHYSSGVGSARHRVRAVCFKARDVAVVVRRWN